MDLDKQTILTLVKSGTRMMEKKKLVITYNSIGCTNKIDSAQEDSDFFQIKK